MDPFDRFPAEICLNILVHCPRREFASLCQGSPTFFRVRKTHESYLQKERLVAELGEDVVYDALAVILFPRLDYTSTTRLGPSEIYSQIEAIDSHLQRWGTRKLPDPWNRCNIQLLEALTSAVNQVRLYISDYLSKATSAYLPTAYSQLPEWSKIHRQVPSSLSSSSRRPTTSMESSGADSEVRPKRFPLSTLSDCQYRAIFKAFFRHELLCKIYGPHSAPRQPSLVHSHEIMAFGGGRYRKNTPQLGHDRHPAYLKLMVWNWRILDTYCDQLERMSATEVHLMHCVREYIRLLYHVLIPLPMTMGSRAWFMLNTVGRGVPRLPALVSAPGPEVDWACSKYYHLEYEHAGFPKLGSLAHRNSNQWLARDYILALCTCHGLDHLTAALNSPDALETVAARFFPIYDWQDQILNPDSRLIVHDTRHAWAQHDEPTRYPESTTRGRRVPWKHIGWDGYSIPLYDGRKRDGQHRVLPFSSFDMVDSMSHLCRQRAWALFECHGNGDYLWEAAKNRLPDGHTYSRFVRKHLLNLYEMQRGQPGYESSNLERLRGSSLSYHWTGMDEDISGIRHPPGTVWSLLTASCQKHFWETTSVLL
ncbi:hypothetical protein V8F20_007888 [Naviculisporaceae sp. PSN 640]